MTSQWETPNLKHTELLQLLDYNPDTGGFTRKITRGAHKKGEVAGFLQVNHLNRKDWRIGVQGKYYLAQRLAWFYCWEEWPKHQIDHINGDTLDNRIINLRDVSSRVNNQNRRTHRAGHLPGVTFIQRSGKYQAQIRIKNRKKYLGCFDSEIEAHNRYVEELNNLKYLQKESLCK